MRRIFAAVLVFVCGLSVLAPARAQSYALEMNQDCFGRQTREAIKYPISNWDGESRRAHSETIYEFTVLCGGTPTALPRVFSQTAGSSRYRLRGATLYMHVRDERRQMPLSDAERGCRMETRVEGCARTPDELYQICRGNGLCEIEHSAYRCTRQEKVCSRPRTELRYVPVWEPFPVGYAPLPGGARIVELETPRPQVRPTQAPAPSSIPPTTRVNTLATAMPNPMKDIVAELRGPPEAGVWSKAFSGVPVLSLLLFLPCALFYGVARAGDFDGQSENSYAGLLGIGGVLALVWLVATFNGDDRIILFLLFFAFPAVIMWLFSKEFEHFCQGLVFMRVRPLRGELNESDTRLLEKTLQDARDAIYHDRGVSGFWYRAQERAYVEALKTTSSTIIAETESMGATRGALEEESELIDATTKVGAKKTLREDYGNTEQEVQKAELSGRRADAQKNLAERNRGARRAQIRLEEVDELKERKMERDKAEVDKEIAAAKAKAADHQTDQSTSEQARDAIRAKEGETREGNVQWQLRERADGLERKGERNAAEALRKLADELEGKPDI